MTARTPGTGQPILSMRDLVIAFDTPDGVVEAVNGISLDLYPGEVLGIVGESGSGKSQSWMATLGLLADNASTQGEVVFDGHNLLDLDSRTLNTIRGQRISMVFQDPMTSLNPYLDIGTQMMEALAHPRPQPEPGGGATALRGDARPCGDPRCRPPDAPVPARAFRGHAPAGDDRHRPAQ